MNTRSRASWRLTFTAWSIVLVCWAVMTVSIDYDALVLLRRLMGEHGRAPVMLLAAVIALPLIIDAVQNLPRYRRRWLERVRHDPALSIWSSAVPTSTPRVFRETDESAPLTWRERSIVEQGQIAFGRVEHHGELLSVRIDAAWGDTIASRPVAMRGERPRAGSRAPLLFEPGAHVGVAPSLLGLSFLAQAPADERPALQRSDAVRPTVSALDVPVRATLHPVERMSRYHATDVGELSFDGAKLTLSQGGKLAVVRLDKPFRVELSAFLLLGGQCEVNVRIEPRAHSAYRAGEQDVLELKTELSQRRVDRRLACAWVDASYVAPGDFDALWRVIVAAADDAELTASVAVA